MLKPISRARFDQAWQWSGLLGCTLLVVACGSSSDSGAAAMVPGSSAGSAGDGAQGGTGGGAGGVLPGSSGDNGMSGGSAGMGGSAGVTGASGGSGGNLAGANGGSSARGGAGGSSGGLGGSSAGTGGAGTGGSGGSTPNNDYLKTKTRNYGFVQLAASSKNQVTSLTTTLTVPVKPLANTGTLFLWPGIQPGGANFDPIDNGVLQPVLTWGPTCAPNAPRNAYTSWWISAQYVNTFGSDPGYTGCLGGDGMSVAVGDELVLVMTLNGTVWSQTVTDSVSMQSVSFDLDMLGQAQNYAEFSIEIYTENPASDVVFTDTTVTFADAEAAACQPTVRGINDFFTNPQASADGKQCTIDRIVLRAQGVAATTPN
jgi:hypothetical protein